MTRAQTAALAGVAAVMLLLGLLPNRALEAVSPALTGHDKALHTLCFAALSAAVFFWWPRADSWTAFEPLDSVELAFELPAPGARQPRPPARRGILAQARALAVVPRNSLKAPFFRTAIVMAFASVGSELLQGLSPFRAMDPADIAYNLLGSAGGLAAAASIQWLYSRRRSTQRSRQ